MPHSYWRQLTDFLVRQLRDIALISAASLICLSCGQEPSSDTVEPVRTQSSSSKTRSKGRQDPNSPNLEVSQSGGERDLAGMTPPAGTPASMAPAGPGTPPSSPSTPMPPTSGTPPAPTTPETSSSTVVSSSGGVTRTETTSATGSTTVITSSTGGGSSSVVVRTGTGTGGFFTGPFGGRPGGGAGSGRSGPASGS